MNFIRIKSDCIAAGRQLRAGEIVKVDDLTARDRNTLVGLGLAEAIERYEVPDPAPTVADPAPKATKKKAAKK